MNPTTRWITPLLLSGVVLAGVAVAGQPAPASAPPSRPAVRQRATATPESVGISSARLANLHRGMQGFVDRREAAGIVTLVAREGKIVDVHAVGFQDVEKRVPMKADTIFRIASMTKPITSVATMMLEEDGRLLLTDPVSRFIPAFKGPKVMGEDGRVVSAAREITIRDLLTHRAGLSYGFLNAGAVGNTYRQNGVADGLTLTSMTTAEAIEKLAAQPLMAQPGSAWNYSLSDDVLGRVVEVASGKPFEVFLQERLIGPLKMVDTSFVVSDRKWSRLATVYSPDSAGAIRPMKDPETFVNTVMSPIASYKAPKKYFSGGAGLTSTIADYARFAQMLVNGGVLDGVRVLSPKTIDIMTMSHTGDLASTSGGPLGPGNGWGLGFRVVTDVAATQTYGSAGMYGWSGIYGTNFFIDPKEKLVAIMMVQRYPGSTVAASFQPLVYQSLTR